MKSFKTTVSESAQMCEDSAAATHYPQDAPDYYPELLRWFPIDMPESGAVWGEIDAINW